MVFEAKFDSLEEVSNVQKLAAAVEEPVYFESQDRSIRVDARSFIGVFVLDFSQPIRVVTDSLYVIRRLEFMGREKAQAHQA